MIKIQDKKAGIYFSGGNQLDPPPPYEDLPPSYSSLDVNVNVPQFNLVRLEGHSRGSLTGTLTPIPQGRMTSFSLHRNPQFGTHLNTGSTNTPVTTPAGSMFRSSIPSTREHSASSSHVRTMNMVTLETRACPGDVPQIVVNDNG